MRSRNEAEIIAVAEQINSLLDDLARTVADMTAVLNGQAPTRQRSSDDW